MRALPKTAHLPTAQAKVVTLQLLWTCAQRLMTSHAPAADVAGYDVDEWQRQHARANENERTRLGTPPHPLTDQWQRPTPRLRHTSRDTIRYVCFSMNCCIVHFTIANKIWMVDCFVPILSLYSSIQWLETWRLNSISRWVAIMTAIVIQNIDLCTYCWLF